jgi:hypothetical protein
MKKILTLAALAVLTIALSARALDDGKTRGEKKISGTIARVDTSSRALTVADAKGVNWQILWSDATKVMGGELKEGASVELGYVESENRNVASWIRVQEAKK